MYSPTLGRFLQPDPSGYQGSGMNLYAYVGNDPLDATDPTELTTYYIEFGGTLVGGLGGKVGGGIFFTTQNAYGDWDIGVFKNPGIAVGANIGVGGVVGYVNGSLSNFQGKFINFDASVLVGQGSVSFSPAGSKTFSNGPVGWSGGLSLSPTVGGIDMSVTNTTATGLFQDIVMPNLPFDPSSFSTSNAAAGQSAAPSSSSAGLNPVNWGNAADSSGLTTLNVGNSSSANGTSVSETPK